MMKDNKIIWIVVFALAIGMFAIRVAFLPSGFGKGYTTVNEEVRYRVSPTEIPDEPNFDGEDPIDKWVTAEKLDGWKLSKEDREQRVAKTLALAEPRKFDPKADLTPLAAGQESKSRVVFSWQQTIGIWFAALMTLFVLTFLIGDNPLYKIAESIFIGASAAYWMVVGFWTTLIPNLLAKLIPGSIRGWATPGLSEYESTEWMYLVPLLLGVLLLWRLSPKGGWISRWPMAFFIGVFCGLRLISFLHADFLSQIRNGIVPLYVESGTGGLDTFYASMRSVFLIAGVLTCLVYFFFSIEHKGIVGKTAKVGIWFLMITFGAAFGYTVMGRIALLAIRFEFLFDDWLWLIDPRGRRIPIDEVTAFIGPIFGWS